MAGPGNQEPDRKADWDKRKKTASAPKWDVFGFTNPSFYINAIDDGMFRSDVIVFDWDYPEPQNATDTNSESILKQILDRTFCLVFIFSRPIRKMKSRRFWRSRNFRNTKNVFSISIRPWKT